MIKNNLLISVFSSVVTVVLSLLIFSYFNKAEDEPGAAIKHHPARSLLSDAHTENAVHSMQKSIDNILKQQQLLFKHNQDLLQKIAQLESADQYLSSLTEKTDGDPSETRTNENTNQEELDLAYENNLNEHFDVLKDELLLEEYDSAWASEMDSSLADVEQRLKTLDMGNISISHKDCRSNACLVEFSHQGDINDSILSGALAAAGTREVVLQHSNEDGNEKTIVIYKR